MLNDGSQLPADAVILATGSRPRLWPDPALGKSRSDRVHHLRTIHDAYALASQLKADGHLIVLGAGLIAAEVASVARAHGSEVTLLERGSTPMENGGRKAHRGRDRAPPPVRWDTAAKR